MTDASNGLRKALARKAGVSQLSTEELLAEMSEEQKTALAAALVPASPPAPDSSASDDNDEDDMGDEQKKPKSKKKGDGEHMEDDANGEPAKASAETERAVAVMSSEHVAGRTKLAADLLANQKLSADEIIAILASSAPAGADPEAGAREEMQAALKKAGQSEVEANSGSAPSTNASGDLWGKAYQRLNLIKPAA